MASDALRSRLHPSRTTANTPTVGGYHVARGPERVLQCRLDVYMAEELLDDVEVDAVLKEPACVAPAEAVKRVIRVEPGELGVMFEPLINVEPATVPCPVSGPAMLRTPSSSSTFWS